jgi:glycerol-3-phosphate dehydrogenase (NAD(P)+)
MRTAVLGAGSWGTALAMQLARAGNERVAMWDHDADRAAAMQAARQNQRYLPGLHFPEAVWVSGDLEAVLAGAEVVVEVIPSQGVRAVMAQTAPLLAEGAVLCCASKGIEQGSLLTMDEVLREALPERLHAGLCFLAGPSFAREVAADLPTAVVVAGHSAPAADAVAAALHGGNFRAYHTDDVVGAELGGALKNVIAIACGVSDGCGAGLNARAALITRGLAEITRLAVARGANPLTLAGLAGLGDLVLTCTGDLSRNRRVGLGLGQGKSLSAILAELGQVAEGVTTTAVAVQLAARTGVEMPITSQIHALLFEEKPVGEALRALLGRERKHERA